MMQAKEGFPQRLRKLRTRRQISAQTLAELCGISKNMVYRYESGKTRPAITALVVLADYFGVSTDFLLGRGS